MYKRRNGQLYSFELLNSYFRVLIVMKRISKLTKVIVHPLGLSRNIG